MNRWHVGYNGSIYVTRYRAVLGNIYVTHQQSAFRAQVSSPPGRSEMLLIIGNFRQPEGNVRRYIAREGQFIGHLSYLD